MLWSPRGLRVRDFNRDRVRRVGSRTVGVGGSTGSISKCSIGNKERQSIRDRMVGSKPGQLRGRFQTEKGIHTSYGRRSRVLEERSNNVHEECVVGFSRKIYF